MSGSKLSSKERRNLSIMVLQILILMIPILLIVIIVKNINQTSNCIPYLYSLAASGWIINLGNGRLAQNIDECKYKISIKQIGLMKIIYNTSGTNNMSLIDYVFQISGYILIFIGLIFSTILIIVSRINVVEVNWNSLESTYFVIVLIYSLIIVVIGTIIRMLYYYKEYLWYKHKIR